ncbi:MAG: phosphoglycolate phosphatase [Acidobacteria bacterium]|nr:phosphoglycolate phosphatase [Acidobacteriota bacterium]
MSPPRQVGIMLFDLDGTLIDSRQDLTTALNEALDQLHLPPLTIETVSQFIGDGARKLVERGLHAGLGRDATLEETKQGLILFKEAYGRHLTDSTLPYPNVVEMLRHFQDLPKGVVTNKPYQFTVDLLEALEMARFFSVVIGGDTLPERKPRPEPVLAALTRCQIPVSQAVMVGDSANDILAGRAAGVYTCGVTYGLRPRCELEQAGADVIVDEVLDLQNLFVS